MTLPRCIVVGTIRRLCMPTKSVPALSCLLLVFGLLMIPAPTRAKDEKLKPEQLIAKHLDSIGTAEKLKAVTTRSTAGTTHVDFRVGGSASLNGEGNIITDG